MEISDLNIEKDVFVSPNETNKEKILKIFETNKITQLPVVEEKRVVGILNLFNLLNTSSMEVDVKSIMETKIITGKREQLLTDFTDLEQGILPIIDKNGEYLSFITKEALLLLVKCHDYLATIRQKYNEEIQYYKDLKDEYDAIFDSSYDGIYITDGKGITLRLNKACERIEGVTAKDVIGKHMKELVDMGVYSESVTLKVLEKKAPVTILQNVQNGKEVIATGNPVFKNGEIIRVVTNSRDITELNRLKKELYETKQLTEKYHSELEILRQEQTRTGDIIVKSSAMRKVIDLVVHVAKVDSTVLIQGESGVGKEIIAKIIHRNSNRRKGPFIKVNCGAIPETLLESELFGYEKGAFTGASKTGKIGLIELANEGTFFLDEIGELSLNLQVKLLRVLQEREILRVGGEKPIPVDIRIIAATNRDLKKMVQEKAFRDDLYYRLNVVPVTVPPLRERKDDIQPFIMLFLNKFNNKYNLQKRISPEVVETLIQYDWPGNVRELENLIERLVVTVSEEEISVEHLPGAFRDYEKGRNTFTLNDFRTYQEAINNFEKNLLITVMKNSKSTQEMAEILNVNRSTITRKLKKHNIKIPF